MHVRTRTEDWAGARLRWSEPKELTREDTSCSPPYRAPWARSILQRGLAIGASVEANDNPRPFYWATDPDKVIAIATSIANERPGSGHTPKIPN